MKTLLYIIPAAVFLFTGCAQQKSEVYASFLMPPKEIKNINDVKNINININKIKVTGLSNRKATKDVANMIKGKLSALVYKEQFLEVEDDILNKKYINNFNKNTYNVHGYGKFTKDAKKTSQLSIDVKININKTKGNKKVITKLYTQNYKTVYRGKKFPRPVGVPSGRAIVNNLSTIVPFVNYVATADISVKLSNANKKVIYTRTFPNLSLEKKLGGTSKEVIELPTDLSIVSELITDKLRAIVFDLSPHKESRKLVLNEAGDLSVIALMKATAFSEAHQKLDSLINKAQVNIEKEEKLLKAELALSLKKAKDQKAKDQLTKSYNDKIKNLSKPFAADYENMGILMEIFGDLEDSNNWYSQAAEADSANKTAQLSATRVSKVFNDQKSLKKMMKKSDIKAKSTFQEKDNKDR